MKVLKYRTKMEYDLDKKTVIERLRAAVDNSVTQSYGFVLVGEINEDSFNLGVRHLPYDFSKEVIPTPYSEMQRNRPVELIGKGRIYTEQGKTVIEMSDELEHARIIFFFVPLIIFVAIVCVTTGLGLAFPEIGVFEFISKHDLFVGVLFDLSLACAIYGVVRPIAFYIRRYRVRRTIHDAIMFAV